jgi:mannose-6-phosphate isomerase-like protein (cupin superfamily)
VKQGGRLSLQMHHHHAEHWVVVRGTARVTVGDSVRLLHENEFDLRTERCPAPAGKSGQVRPGANRGATGSYLGEDDIVRIEHEYHRS